MAHARTNRVARNRGKVNIQLRLAFALYAAVPLVVLHPACLPQQAPPPTAAASLFGDRAHDLVSTDQHVILSLLGFELSADGVLVDAVCRQPVLLNDVAIRDLDRDGTPEVIIFGGNMCISGGTGQSLVVFAKDTLNTYHKVLNFPVASYEMLSRPAGLPDFRLIGLRPCAGVWRWNGSTYEHLRNEALAPSGCDL
jgi:hypothetical protein